MSFSDMLLAALLVSIVSASVFGIFDNWSKYDHHKSECDKKNGELITNAAGAYLCIERGILK